MLGRRLTDDAHEAWKWGSMRFLALGGSMQAAVLAADRTGLSVHLPAWMLSAASGGAFVCLIAAGVSRVTVKDGDSDVRNSDASNPGS
jgi:hypothetical protein